MAKMTFNSPTIIQKGVGSQLRITASEYEGHTRLDIREFRIFGGNKDHKATKQGVTVPLANVAAFLAAVSKHSKELPKRVVDLDNGTFWMVGKTIEDAQFKKTHVYPTENEALASAPPDRYNLFKVLIEKGAVTRERLEYVRDGGDWCEPPPPVVKKKKKKVVMADVPSKKSVKTKTTAKVRR